MPMSATWTRGRLDTSRPLPSFVTRTIEPGVADAEVRAGDADVGGMERLAQLAPRGARQLLELGRDGCPVHRGEQLGDVLLRLLDRRRDDVDGVLAGELEDVLAEIGLDRRGRPRPRAPR